MCILWYIHVCVGIFIYGYVYILDFSFYIGLYIYNIKATKRV